MNHRAPGQATAPEPAAAAPLPTAGSKSLVHGSGDVVVRGEHLLDSLRVRF